jgi:hypothetical protein
VGTVYGFPKLPHGGFQGFFNLPELIFALFRRRHGILFREQPDIACNGKKLLNYGIMDFTGNAVLLLSDDAFPGDGLKVHILKNDSCQLQIESAFLIDIVFRGIFFLPVNQSSRDAALIPNPGQRIGDSIDFNLVFTLFRERGRIPFAHILKDLFPFRFGKVATAGVFCLKRKACF